MSSGVNRVFFGGHLGADPELRVTQSGTSVLKMRIASGETWVDKYGQKQEKTEWGTVVVWGRRAEALSKFLTKGMKVFVEGKLETSSWQDKEGNKRYSTQIVASNVLLGGSNNPRGKNQMRDPQERRPSVRDRDDEDYQPDASAPSRGGGGYDDQDYGGGDDDIPF